MTTIQISAIQNKCVADPQTNIEKSVAAIKTAAADGTKLILLQELHRSLYFCQTENHQHFSLAETIPGPTTKLFQTLAKELKVIIVTSIFEKRATGLYHNTAVVLDQNGSIAGTYRKMHIPDDPGFYEKFYFAPGDKGFTPIQTSIGKLGILICWDQWYPEAARLMALAGADILLYPTAIGWGTQENDPGERERQLQAWLMIQRSHAIANGLTVIAANRTGFEPAIPDNKEGIEFWGNSFIAGPQGEILIQASSDEEQTITAEVDLKRHEQVRHGWPFLRDRRIEDYRDINKRYID